MHNANVSSQLSHLTLLNSIPPPQNKSFPHPLLPPERAAFGESGLATGGLAEHLRAAGADDDGLGVAEDGGDCEAAGALDVHEEGAGAGDECLCGGVRG